MRPRIWKELRRLWVGAMNKELPDFRKYAGEPLPNKCLAWRRENPELIAFVVLLTHTREDLFDIELSFGQAGGQALTLTECRRIDQFVRLSELSEPTDPRARWWEIVPEETWDETIARIQKGKFFPSEEDLEVSLGRVPAVVEDAMSQLLRKGMEFFENPVRRSDLLRRRTAPSFQVD